MPNTLPPLSPEQRADALAKAAEARKVRAEVKAGLKAGTLTLLGVLADAEADQTLAKFKVSALIEAMPGVGKVRAAQIMSRCGIAEGRRVRGLGSNQRTALEQEFAA